MSRHDELYQKRLQREKNKTDAGTILERMGAKFDRFEMFNHSKVRGVVEISIWHWPKESAGTRYDQRIICRVYCDGGFDLALEAGAVKISDVHRQIREMARASEKIYE